MENYKIIIIIVLIILFLYIGYRLLKKIQCCKKQLKEGLENIDTLKEKDNVTINSIHAHDTKMPLKEYVIKASYNSAITGKYADLDMIKYVLSRGCRFLDFEIFLINGKPCVAYTNDSKYKTIETLNNILLDDVLTTIVSNAFSDNSPNRKDPLFIHLRIKYANPSKKKIYTNVAKSLSLIQDSLYKKKINEKTTMANIMGKIVIVMDNTIQNHYIKYTNCGENKKDCFDLNNYINIESNNYWMNIQRYSDILNKKIQPPRVMYDNKTDSEYIKLALPDYDVKHVSNPKLSQMVADYGIQIVTYRFYNKDEALHDMENIFNENKYGIVPLATMIQYFDKKKEELST